MSHQEKQEIFDRYAKNQGFKDWEDVQVEHYLALMSDDELKLYIFTACDLVQEEQQKRIAENAKTTIINAIHKWQGVDKDSIINPENIIK